MTWLPGSPRPAVRQLQVPADASAVMAWLTDQDRRERDWRSRSEVAGVRQMTATRLPNGGLRFESVQVRGSLVAQHITEDIAVESGRIRRVMRGQAASSGRRARWQLSQRISVSSLGGTAMITVRVAGKPVGWSRVRHLLGFNDTATARVLTDESTRWADFIVAGVGDQFHSSGGA